MELPHLSKNAVKTVKDTLSKGARLIPYGARKISPHVKLIGLISIEPVIKKKELLPDIIELMKKDMPKKDICKTLNISESYLNKLIRVFNKN